MNNSFINLPKISKKKSAFNKIINERRSCRVYKKIPPTLEEISKLLFSGQGITDKKNNKRIVPSAGALFPIETYLIIGKAKKINPGIYKYLPETHQLTIISQKDVRKELVKATLFQRWIEDAPITIILCGVFWRTMIKYGKRGIPFVYMEIGHIAQNISLQAIELGMGSVCIGGFNKKKVRKILNLESESTPLYLMSLGKRFKDSSDKEKDVLKEFHCLIKKYFEKYET